MKKAFKRFLSKNERVYVFLKRIQILLMLIKIYFLSIFNFLRKDNCSKNSLRCEYDINNKHYNYTLLGKDTPVCCLTHLYEILRDISYIFNKVDIDYFIMYGTLLGHTRHNQSFIPWDTDVDIVVMKKDKEKIVNLLKNKINNIYDIVENEKILKINYSKKNRLHVDIYIWDEENGILIDNLNDYWIKNRIKKADVFPLISSELYGIPIKIPKNSKKVLIDIYGIDCFEIAYKKYALKQKTMKEFHSGQILK